MVFELRVAAARLDCFDGAIGAGQRLPAKVNAQSGLLSPASEAAGYL
jgi:hypothetical protein